MRAKNKAEYVKLWNSHINEITSVLYESGIPVVDWDVLLHPLRNAVNTAADKLEAKGEWPPIPDECAVGQWNRGMIDKYGHD